jgi:AraC family transcriptional regulator, transcriptional activator of the genes for pyochelin and ferripyochelin receptors
MTAPLVHYPDLLDRDHAASALGLEALQAQSFYLSGAGFRHPIREGGQSGALEVVRLHRDVYLILHQCRGYRNESFRQEIRNGHWVHVQFCASGNGVESLGSTDGQLETHDGMCTITSYADEAVVARDLFARDEERTACLYMRGSMVEQFFRLAPEALPAHMHWLMGRGTAGVQFHTMEMHAHCYSVLTEMFACEFQSHARLAFMQAKSAELMATLLHSLSLPTAVDRVLLTPEDRRKIASAREVIDEELGVVVSLPQLAARVGLNRSKLAAGFRETYGTPVQAYARNARLDHARELLRGEHLPISVVAERVGYSELSSFSRAFTAKFGISPKRMRRLPHEV